jgi:hypothetical protein
MLLVTSLVLHLNVNQEKDDEKDGECSMHNTDGKYTLYFNCVNKWKTLPGKSLGECAVGLFSTLCFVMRRNLRATDAPAVTMPVYVPLRVIYLPLNVTSGIRFSVNCSAVLATTAQKGHSFLNHVYQQAYVCSTPCTPYSLWQTSLSGWPQYDANNDNMHLCGTKRCPFARHVDK